MRKHCKRIMRRCAAPTLVALHLNPEVCLQERAAVLALRSGWADRPHYNVLADCRDMLTLAASSKNDRQTLAICELARIALENIKDRFVEKQRMGATGDELQALDALCDISEDFWRRQGGTLFIDAEAALSRAREAYRRAA
ncbi:MAG: hypothetical protein PHD19_09550 [Dechloromonas sp.]|nr:hypothetical protein [Dechloromonas sp.]